MFPGGDIPWLKLEVTARRGAGTLAGVTTVQRIDTRGGVMSGACERAGAYLSAPYAADYVFLRKVREAGSPGPLRTTRCRARPRWP